MKKINNGFLYVASKDKIFLTAARYSVTSLKDYYQIFSAKWAKVLADRKSTKTMEEENE